MYDTGSPFPLYRKKVEWAFVDIVATLAGRHDNPRGEKKLEGGGWVLLVLR
jgi:hypothetical protein